MFGEPSKTIYVHGKPVSSGANALSARGEEEREEMGAQAATLSLTERGV